MPRGPEGASVRAGQRSAEWCERSFRPFPAPVGLPHSTTLQHHRRPNVTATVTSIVFWTEQGRTSRIHAATIRRCMLVFSQQSADFSRWCAHTAARPRTFATHPLLRLTLRKWLLRRHHLRGISPQRIFIHCSNILCLTRRCRVGNVPLSACRGWVYAKCWI